MITWLRNRPGPAAMLGLVAMLSVAPAASSVAVAAEHTVEIKAFKFVPEQLTVKPGDTITWINRDVAPHTATSTDKSWDTKRLNKGGSTSVVVTKEMKADYFCRFHPNMKARLTVKLD